MQRTVLQQGQTWDVPMAIRNGGGSSEHAALKCECHSPVGLGALGVLALESSLESAFGEDFLEDLHYHPPWKALASGVPTVGPCSGSFSAPTLSHLKHRPGLQLAGICF